MFRKLIILLIVLSLVILSCSGDENLVGQAQDKAAPAAVSNLSIGLATDISLTVSWAAPGDDGTTGTATQYDLRYSLDSITEDSWPVAARISGEPTPGAAGTAQSMVVGGLAGNKKYFFGLKTGDEVPNWSNLSNIPSGMTLTDSIAPAAIADLAIVDSLISSMILSWTAPGDDSMTGMATRYDIRFDTIAITDSSFNLAFQCSGEPTPSAPGSAETYTVNGLASDKQYFFAIKAIDEAANKSDSSNVASSTTLALSAISDLSITDSTTTSISLAWTSPGINGINSTPLSYDLRYYSDTITDSNWSSATAISGEPTPATSGTAESFTVTGLEYYTEYFFAIRSADAQGNLSPISNLVVDTTVWSRLAFPYSMGVNDGPMGIVAANFDKDSDVDLASINSNAGNIRLIRNNNNGTFTLRSSYTTAEYPVDGVAINVDTDTDIDIIVACRNADSITVLRNSGNMTFSSPAPAKYPAGSDPEAICAADFNGDSFIDVAVANETVDSITIMYNSGTGTYPDSTSKSFAVGDSPRDIIAVDLNNDTYVDLVVANYQDDSVSVLFNDHDTTFMTPVNYYPGDAPIRLQAALIDGDAYYDLVVINANSNSLALFLHDGSGGLGTPSTLTSGNGPYDLVAEDMNNDTFVDLVVVNYYDENVSILLGNGDGTFGTAINYVSGSDPRSIIAAHFNSDGFIDLAVGNLSVDSVGIIINRTIDE